MSDTNLRRECYEELLAEHTRLRALLAELDESLTHRSGSLQDVVQKLQTLRELIEAHFQAEESSDCFAELVNHAPRVSDRVTTMLGEHGELRAEIHEMIQTAGARQGGAADWEWLGTAFREFAAKLMRHEESENELVQEVFTDDIGSKD